MRARSEFLETYEHGQRVAGRAFVLFGRLGPGGTTRLGITVTRKFGDAVERNRIKRRVREIFRTHRGNFVPPLDLVLNVREAARGARTQELEKEFLDLVARLTRGLLP